MATLLGVIAIGVFILLMVAAGRNKIRPSAASRQGRQQQRLGSRSAGAGSLADPGTEGARGCDTVVADPRLRDRRILWKLAVVGLVIFAALWIVFIAHAPRGRFAAVA